MDSERHKLSAGLCCEALSQSGARWRRHLWCRMLFIRCAFLKNFLKEFAPLNSHLRKDPNFCNNIALLPSQHLAWGTVGGSWGKLGIISGFPNYIGKRSWFPKPFPSGYRRVSSSSGETRATSSFPQQLAVGETRAIHRESRFGSNWDIPNLSQSVSRILLRKAQTNPNLGKQGIIGTNPEWQIQLCLSYPLPIPT